MIHAIELSQVNLERLTDIVHIQMDLLYFAASEDFVNLEIEAKKKCCKEYFDEGKNLHQSLQGRGEAIANWLWQSGTTARHVNLENFAKAWSKVSSGKNEEELKKRITAWCRQLHTEVEELLLKDCLTITVGNHFYYPNKPSGGRMRELREQGLLHWKEYAKDFLLYFYEAHLGGVKASFPAEIFTAQGTEEYGRREFLSAFLRCNRDLEICPFCDETRFHIKNNSARTSIDHFLPKDIYPHLACHPYNLVPTCYFCNSTVKGQIDPFLYTEHRLSRDSFPYGKTKLSKHSYLKIVFAKEPATSYLLDKTLHIRTMELAPHKTFQDETTFEHVKEVITLSENLYGIPKRWKDLKGTGEYVETMQATQICETLMRRIRQFLWHGEQFLVPQEPINSQNDVFAGGNFPLEIYSRLKQLLYYLDHDDRGKDPFVFAMTWILATLIKEDAQPTLLSSLEVGSVPWLVQAPATNAERDEHVKALLNRLEE